MVLLVALFARSVFPLSYQRYLLSPSLTLAISSMPYYFHYYVMPYDIIMRHICPVIIAPVNIRRYIISFSVCFSSYFIVIFPRHAAFFDMSLRHIFSLNVTLKQHLSLALRHFIVLPVMTLSVIFADAADIADFAAAERAARYADTP
jgi:hypothetical protein